MAAKLDLSTRTVASPARVQSTRRTQWPGRRRWQTLKHPPARRENIGTPSSTTERIRETRHRWDARDPPEPTARRRSSRSPRARQEAWRTDGFARPKVYLLPSTSLGAHAALQE